MIVALLSACSERSQTESPEPPLEPGLYSERSAAPDEGEANGGTERLLGQKEASPEAEEESVAETERDARSAEAELASGEKAARREERLRELTRPPLDVERLLSGILQKYELDELDNPSLQVGALLTRYDAGDRSVLLDLGLLLAYGGEGIADRERAKDFLEEAAVAGEARALAELGRLYLSGFGVPRDGELARSYFEQAMDGGDAEGAFLLGMGHRNGLWGESDNEEGLTMLETAANLGHVAAAVSLFRLAMESSLEDGEGKSTQEKKALLRERLAEHGDFEAWLTAGMEQGDIPAMLHLAKVYQFEGEKAKALAVWQTAAELGSFNALAMLMDYSSPRFREPEYRASFSELLRPHAEAESDVLGPALFRLAMIEMLNGWDHTEETLRLLEESLAARYHAAGVALSDYEKGVPLPHAISKAWKLGWIEAYLQLVKIEHEALEASEDSQEVSAPYWLKAVLPAYPAELMAESESGRVLVEAAIDREGRVVRVQVVESTHVAFDAPAMEAVRQSEFKPAIRSGKAEAARIRVPIHFTPPR